MTLLIIIVILSPGVDSLTNVPLLEVPTWVILQFFLDKKFLAH